MALEKNSDALHNEIEEMFSGFNQDGYDIFNESATRFFQKNPPRPRIRNKKQKRRQE